MLHYGSGSHYGYLGIGLQRAPTKGWRETPSEFSIQIQEATV